MESLVHFIMSNGTMVITTLLGGIIFCVFGLLIMSFHSPKLAVAQEVGSIDRLEGVLRQMLSDQDFSKGATGGGENEQVSLLKEQVSVLEKEVKEKSQLLEKSSTSTASAIDDGKLQDKIKELEAKLAEYSIIEEDISDLSKFRQENEELRNRINEVTGMPAAEALALPWDEFEKIVKEKKSKSAKEDVKSNTMNTTES